MRKDPFPGVPGMEGLPSRPQHALDSTLSLQLCVPSIFSKLNLTLLFPVHSQALMASPSLGEALDLAYHQDFPFQTAVWYLGGARSLWDLSIACIRRRRGSSDT